MENPLKPNGLHARQIAFDDRAGFERALLDSGLGPVAGALSETGRPAIVLVHANPEDRSRSKLGGLPDLPQGQSWPVRDAFPRTTHADGSPKFFAISGVPYARYYDMPQPLDFIAQIDLGELANAMTEAAGLPQRGMLYFFYDLVAESWGDDPDEAPAFRVLFHDCDTALAPVASPGRTPPIEPLPELRLRPHQAFTIPSVWALQDRIPDLPEAVRIAYGDLRDRVLRPEYPAGPAHQVLGIAHEIQSTMEGEIALTAAGIDLRVPGARQSVEAERVRAQKSEWQLLLQIDSDDDEGMMWGDAGMLYWWIRRSDLMARDFSKVWLRLQCY